MSEAKEQPKIPLPRPTAISAPFWEAARQGRLLLQYCPRCQRYIFYPRPYCIHCLGELEWREASGRGRVYSFTIVRRPATPAFADKVPYVYAIVELEEGVRMTANIVGCRPEEVRVDMPVRAVFEPAGDDVSLVHFAPA
jgi:uncharacterized OB-fold protein